MMTNEDYQPGYDAIDPTKSRERAADGGDAIVAVNVHMLVAVWPRLHGTAQQREDGPSVAAVERSRALSDTKIVEHSMRCHPR